MNKIETSKGEAIVELANHDCLPTGVKLPENAGYNDTLVLIILRNKKQDNYLVMCHQDAEHLGNELLRSAKHAAVL